MGQRLQSLLDDSCVGRGHLCCCPCKPHTLRRRIPDGALVLPAEQRGAWIRWICPVIEQHNRQEHMENLSGARPAPKLTVGSSPLHRQAQSRGRPPAAAGAATPAAGARWGPVSDGSTAVQQLSVRRLSGCLPTCQPTPAQQLPTAYCHWEDSHSLHCPPSPGPWHSSGHPSTAAGGCHLQT
jgi:hypothetical protein